MRMNSKMIAAAIGVTAMLSPMQLLAQTAAPAAAAPVAAAPAAPAAAGKKYSTARTQLGTLLADPAAKAVLVKHIPQLVNGGQSMDQASGMTLRELQDAVKAYAPDMLTDKVLAAVDVDLAALPAH